MPLGSGSAGGAYLPRYAYTYAVSRYPAWGRLGGWRGGRTHKSGWRWFTSDCYPWW